MSNEHDIKDKDKALENAIKYLEEISVSFDGPKIKSISSKSEKYWTGIKNIKISPAFEEPSSEPAINELDFDEKVQEKVAVFKPMLRSEMMYLVQRDALSKFKRLFADLINLEIFNHADVIPHRITLSVDKGMLSNRALRKFSGIELVAGTFLGETGNHIRWKAKELIEEDGEFVYKSISFEDALLLLNTEGSNSLLKNYNLFAKD